MTDLDEPTAVAAPADGPSWGSRWPRLSGDFGGPGPVEVVLGVSALVALVGYLVAMLRGRRESRGTPRGIPATTAPEGHARRSD